MPDNTAVPYLVPLRFHRLQPEKGGVRKPYGGTLSLRFKRGSWVKRGVCYVGGTTGGLISLRSLQDGKRLTKVRPGTVQFLNRSSWRVRKGGSPNRGGAFPTANFLLGRQMCFLPAPNAVLSMPDCLNAL